MRIARICDPEAREPYPNFVHNTTTYVAIPHDRPSLLFVFNDEEPCSVAIMAEGREIHVERLVNGQAVIELHRFRAPAPQPTNVTETLASLISLARRKPHCRENRLYAFSIVLRDDTPEQSVLATYDFHVLCPTEYEAACAYHHEICQSPKVISPDTISDRAEGRACPNCREVRKTRG